MATVYLARDIKHARKVAIKVLDPELASLVGAERFLREIRIAANLQHPNILPLHDSGEADELLYYVMPYVEGESLRQRLERKKQLGLDEALQITQEIAGALEYAHQHGVVHRDVKPENILLSPEHAVIADFGIARAISEAGGDRVTETGHTVGTPAYMSPEQAGGETQLDGRSDIYSLGCVVYEMLAGEPPFTGRTAQAVFAQHMLERPPSIEIVRPSVPPGVAGAIKKALQKVPEDRFASAQAFNDTLRDPTVTGVADEARRHRGRRFAGATALVAVAVAVAAWALFWIQRDQLDPNRIVVFPLVEPGADRSDEGWDVGIAITSALEQAQPLIAYDAWRWLSESQREDARRVTLEAARQIVRAQGARYYVDGFIRRDGLQSALTLNLNDLEADSIVARHTESGTSDSVTLPQLGLRAVAELLPHLLDPGREFDLTPLTNRKPAAIALWIQGEREYRRTQFGPALDFYRRAVEEDSLLVLAAIKGAQAASWTSGLTEAAQLVAVALAHEALLPRKYQGFARGLHAYLQGQADSATIHFRDALSAGADLGETSMALGEVFYHLVPSEGPQDSIAEALFITALQYDSAFTVPLTHLAEIALRAGDVRRADAYIQKLQAVGADSSLITHLDLMRACVGDRPRAFDWHRVADQYPRRVLFAAKSLSGGGAQRVCAKEGFRAVLAADSAPAVDKWGALFGLQNLLAAEGNSAEALALLDSAITTGMGGAYSLYVFDELVGMPTDGRATEAESIARRYTGDTYEGAQIETRWLLGVWLAQRGELERVRTITESIAAEATEYGSRRAKLLSSALEGHLALALGDTSEAIAHFSSLAPTAPRDSLEWEQSEPLAVEWITLARLLLERGRFEEALRVAAVFDHPAPIAYLPYIPASLAIRMQAARRLGRADAAAQYEERLTSFDPGQEGQDRKGPETGSI